MPVQVQQDKYHRTEQQIQETYEAEKELAKTLMNASKEERRSLYTQAYDEFFQKISHHPLLNIRNDRESIEWIVRQRMSFLKHFLYPDATYLEVGPGDCSLAIAIARQVKKVYAVDVSNEVTRRSDIPDNFELLISDGCSIPAPENSVDIAFSHQLMEHLHPDDALEQLQNLYRALKPGGIYICITPNRLSGPHDTSQFFDDIATGWHLKEYTVSELYDLFTQVGFSKLEYCKIRNEMNAKLPLNGLTIAAVRAIEGLLEQLPAPQRRQLALKLSFRGITLVATK